MSNQEEPRLKCIEEPWVQTYLFWIERSLIVIKLAVLRDAKTGNHIDSRGEDTKIKKKIISDFKKKIKWMGKVIEWK